jgi:hypothetical protein
MIDRIAARIGPVGIDTREYRKLLKELKLDGQFAVRHVKVVSPIFMGGVAMLDFYPDYLDVAFCPMKVLGSGNCYGDSDLQVLFRRCVRAIFNARGLTLPASIWALIKAGEYRLKEVHITEHFYLQEHGISECIRALERALKSTYEVQRIGRGVGFEINPRNRRLAVLIYNKQLEFQKKGLKLYEERRASADDWNGPLQGLDLSIQRFVAAAGPRVEFKFSDHFFNKKQSLRKAANWKPDTAVGLYRNELADLKFPKKVDAVWARRQAELKLSPQAMRTYLLWARGEPWPVVVGTRDTWRKHRAEILAVLRLDINASAQTVHGMHSVDVEKVFSWENRVVLSDEVLDRRLGSLNEHMPLLA